MHDTGFFYLFFPSIDGVKLGKGPDVPWGIFFAQATVGSLLGNFMTSPGSATAAAGPPQRWVPCLSLNHQPSYDSQLLYLAGRDSGHSWANQPTNQPTLLEKSYSVIRKAFWRYEECPHFSTLFGWNMWQSWTLSVFTGSVPDPYW